MNLIEFEQAFPSESDCRIYFKLIRDKEGILCKRCKNEAHYWLPSKQMYECKSCGRRISLRSGTTLENSKLPFRLWFLAMHLMVSTKKNISALEVQRQIGHKYYEPVWAMMQKIRRSMGNKDEKRYPMLLKEAYLTNFPASKICEGKCKPHRKTDPQKNKSVPVAVITSDWNSGIGKRLLNPIRMVSLAPTPSNASPIRRTNLHKKPRTMRKLVKPAETRSNLILRLEDKKEGIVAENAVLGILGIHYGVSATYLQNYLNEFCFKLNRRHRRFSIFDELIAATTSHWCS